MEIEDMDAKLKAKGVELNRGPCTSGPRIAFLDGPDGVEIELIEPADK